MCAPLAHFSSPILVLFSPCVIIAASSFPFCSPFLPFHVARLHLVFLSDVFVSPQWHQVEHHALLKRIIYENSLQQAKAQSFAARFLAGFALAGVAGEMHDGIKAVREAAVT